MAAKSVKESELSSGRPSDFILGLVGRVFGRATVTEFAGFNLSGTPYMRCLCSCGRQYVANPYHIKSGASLSCGCLKAATNIRLRRKHGYAPFKGSRKSVYRIWKGMNYRCSNPNNSHWKHYGGRGITVCEDWRTSFSRFLQDMGEPPAGYSLDRVDCNKGYCPENCRWIPKGEQAKNRLFNWSVLVDGEQMTARDASRRLRLHKSYIDSKLNKAGLDKREVHDLRKLSKTSPIFATLFSRV